MTDPESTKLLSYVTSLAKFQQEYNVLDKEELQGLAICPPGSQIHIKTWKGGTPGSQLTPLWKGPLTVLFSTSTEINVAVISSWIHHT